MPRERGQPEKAANDGGSKTIRGDRGLGGAGMNRRSSENFGGGETALYDTAVGDAHRYARSEP